MAAPKIEKLLTPYNFTNKDNAGRIKYIVIHYVGALGGAEANCKYYASKYLGASAHYFVGFNGEVWQSVEDEDIAWHCGASSYKHAECRNSNSIGTLSEVFEPVSVPVYDFIQRVNLLHTVRKNLSI